MENKYETAKKIFELNKDKKNKYALMFDYLKKEITDMLKEGMQITTIKNALIVKTGIKDINHSTLQMWINRNINLEEPKTKQQNRIITNSKIKEDKEEKVEDKLEKLKKQIDVFN